MDLEPIDEIIDRLQLQELRRLLGLQATGHDLLPRHQQMLMVLDERFNIGTVECSFLLEGHWCIPCYWIFASSLDLPGDHLLQGHLILAITLQWAFAEHLQLLLLDAQLVFEHLDRLSLLHVG